MTIKIGLLSDVHATAAPVEEALAIFRKQGVDSIFCAGDIAGYGDELDRTVELLMGSGCKSILGNHDLWYLDDAPDELENPTAGFFSRLPPVLELAIEGKSVYLVHASPPQSYMDGIRLLDEHGVVIPEQRQQWTERLAGFSHDVLVVGHTHQIFAEMLGDTLVINPGSTKFNHSCAILKFPDLEFQVLPLSNKTPLRAWNWGISRIEAEEVDGSG